MVVDQGVDVVVADLGLRSRVCAVGAALGAPAAAVGDPAELLDVHVDQLARAGRARSGTAVVFEARISCPVSGSQSAR